MGMTVGAIFNIDVLLIWLLKKKCLRRGVKAAVFW